MPRLGFEPIFNQAQWSEKIEDPLWYVDYVQLIKEAHEYFEVPSEEIYKILRESRHFFEKELLAGRVALGKRGPDLDKERLPIDTVVIHHTSHEPPYRLTYLNAVHLLNIYAPYYVNPSVEEQELKDQPIYSGHFDEQGNQVFYGYHWLMRMDGSFERLLPDEAIGWHADNWEVNRRSIAICLDNDYEHHDGQAQDPSEFVLRSLAKHIAGNYPQVQPYSIVGHQEVGRKPTICPGDGWQGGWKNTLVDMVEEERQLDAA